MDMRGFNDSDKPAGIQSYFILNMVTDIKELVSGLGKSTCSLVGHDWGGVVCWTFAAFHPVILSYNGFRGFYGFSSTVMSFKIIF